MAFLSRLASIVFIVAIPVLLVATNIRFFAGEVRLYERGFRVNQADQVTRVAMPELDRAAREIINYFENDTGTLRIVVTQQGQEISLFNARETQHMKDVKWLMQIIFRLQEISLAFVLSYITTVYLWSRERSLRTLAKQALAGIGVGFAVVGALGVAVLTGGFHAVWDRFHMIVFRNNLWQLNPARDRLIQMFPEPFWQESAYIVTAITLAEAALVVILASAYLVFARQRRTGGARPQRQPLASADMPAPPPADMTGVQ